MTLKTHKMILDSLEGFPEQKITSLLDYIEFLKRYAPDKNREGAGNKQVKRNDVPEAGP